MPEYSYDGVEFIKNGFPEMRFFLKKIAVLLSALLVLSCGVSEDMLSKTDEYNTPLFVSVTAFLASDAYYDNDKYTIIITSSENDTIIKYTIDGSDPSRTNGIEGTPLFAINNPAGTVEVRVVIYDPNRISPVASITITGGDGSVSYPFEIATAEHLKNLANNVNNGIHTGSSFRQTADIDLSAYNTGTGWTPIGTASNPFTGLYNGNSFNINYLFINNGSADYQGLFGDVASGAILQYINILNANVTGGDNTGALAGYVNDTNITGCNASADVSSTSENTGGLIGHYECSISGGCTISSCSSSGQVTGADNVGGLIGNNGLSVYGATITNCSSSSSVTGTNNVGGLSGLNFHNGNITSCNASGVVTGTATRIGGLVGNNMYSAVINGSYATGSVNASTATPELIGGLVGNNMNSAEINSSYATGDVNASTATYAGGLVGQNSAGGIIGSNNYTTGNISAADFTGGFVGYNNAGTVGNNNYTTRTVSGAGYTGGFTGSNTGTTGTNNYATGNVTGSDYTGGFAGSNTGTIGTNNYATGNVSGISYVGGFIGSHSSAILLSNCYSNGTVTGTASNIGGFIGSADASSDITYCYARGNINISSGGGDSVGGFIGQIGTGSQVQYCFARGDLTVTGSYAYMGGFAGANDGTILNCYSTGDVQSSGPQHGGFTGYTNSSSIITNCYSVGNVSGGSSDGGFIGEDNAGAGSYTNCFWLKDGSINPLHSDSSGGDLGTGVENKIQSDMTAQTTFDPLWDFGTTWTIVDGGSYPYLQYEPPGYVPIP